MMKGWGHTGRISESLGLHDSLHVGRPTELTGNEDTRGFGDSVGNNNLLDLLAKVLLDGGTKILVVLDIPVC
jgi:hypothetical protein